MAGTVIGELSGILECAVCLETIQDPKRLICDHSYCKNCIDGLLQFSEDGSAIIKCPKSCKKLTRISKLETTNDLGVDYMLKRIADVMNTKDNGTDIMKKFKCDKRECSRNISTYCVVCNERLCQPCSETHEPCQKITPLVSVQRNLKRDELCFFCEKHSSEASYLCCENKFICLYCKNRLHRGHSYDTLENQTLKLRDMLSKEIEQMESFMEGIDTNLHEIKTDILRSRSWLEKLLQHRKIMCIKDYLDHLNKEEQRIMKEFNTVATSHIEEFLILDPTESYKKYQLIEDIKIIFQRSAIIKNVEASKIERTKKVKEITVSLSDYTFTDRHPLGKLMIKCGSGIPPNEAKGTFKDEFINMVGLSTKKLLQRMQYKTEFPSLEKPGQSEVDDKCPTQMDASSCMLYHQNTFLDNLYKSVDLNCNSIQQSTDINDKNKPIDKFIHSNSTNKIDKYKQNFEKGGMKYIEDLIKQEKNEELISLLHERPDIFYMKSTEPPFHNQPIHMAAKHNNIQFLKELIQYDKSMINLKNSIRSTALHASASYESSIDCFKWLVETYPRMLEHKNENGHTVLHVASKMNSIEAVRVLLNKGVNVWVKNFNGNTPLDLAKQHNYLEVADMLFESMEEQDPSYFWYGT